MTDSTLIIFDCDGVIVDSERLVNRLEADYFSRLGLVLTPKESGRLFKGKTVAQVADVIESTIAADLPRDWMYDWAMTIAAGFAKELVAVAGIEQTLELLSRAGRRFCLASQSPIPRIELSLHVTKLDRYFDGSIFTASMVANPKPAPDIFLLASERMGIAPGNCTVIEDSPSGVVAARAAGMRVLGYAADEEGSSLSAFGAEVFTHMNELPRLLNLRE